MPDDGHVFETAQGEYRHGSMRYCQRCNRWIKEEDQQGACDGNFAVAQCGGG